MNGRRRLALGCAGSWVLLLVAGLPRQASGQAKPEGEMRYALYVTLSPRLVRSRRGIGPAHAVLDPLRAARRPREADAGQHDEPQPGRVLDGQRRPEDLRVQAARGPQVPQWGSLHRRRREVQLSPREGLEDAAREGQGGDGPRARSRAVPAPRPLAGLHDLLRHDGVRGRVDRAQEVRRAGGGRRLQAGARRAWAVQVREPHARCRARDGRLRGLLAEDALGEAAGLQERAREHDAHGDAEARRGRCRLSPRRSPGAGGQAGPQSQAGVLRRHRHLVPRLPRSVGPEVSRGPTGVSARRQLRHRPPGAQRRGDARRVQARGEPRAADLRVRPADRAVPV
jgi:hypothetical protein